VLMNITVISCCLHNYFVTHQSPQNIIPSPTIPHIFIPYLYFLLYFTTLPQKIPPTYMISPTINCIHLPIYTIVQLFDIFSSLFEVLKKHRLFVLLYTSFSDYST
jgi:hypothetical protein